MAISPISALNIFRTQPISFASTQRAEQAKNNFFMSETFSAKNSSFNVNHPNNKSDILAKHIDLDA